MIQITRFTTAIVLFTISVLAMGCTPTIVSEKVDIPTQRSYQPVKFTYEPLQSQTKGDLTLAILSPNFVFVDIPASSANPSYSRWLLKRDLSQKVEEYIDKTIQVFLVSLQTDFEKVLIARGFRTLGPFRDKDLLTYPQREQCDFAIEPKVFIDILDEVTWTEEPKRSKQIIDNIKQPFVSAGAVNGTMTVQARIELHVYEPLSWEKMWIKNASTDVIPKLSYSYKYNFVESNRVVGDDSRPEILSKVLSDSYKDILDKIYLYLDPREFKALSEKAKEIRQKKRF